MDESNKVLMEGCQEVRKDTHDSNFSPSPAQALSPEIHDSLLVHRSSGTLAYHFPVYPNDRLLLVEPERLYWSDSC
jgi:hypothetical protein